jgi:hypothetical protein
VVRREIVMLSKREDVPLCIELRAPDLALHLRRHVLVERVVILAVERSLPGPGRPRRASARVADGEGKGEGWDGEGGVPRVA